MGLKHPLNAITKAGRTPRSASSIVRSGRTTTFWPMTHYMHATRLRFCIHQTCLWRLHGANLPDKASRGTEKCARCTRGVS